MCFCPLIHNTATSHRRCWGASGQLDPQAYIDKIGRDLRPESPKKCHPAGTWLTRHLLPPLPTPLTSLVYAQPPVLLSSKRSKLLKVFLPFLFQRRNVDLYYSGLVIIKSFVMFSLVRGVILYLCFPIPLLTLSDLVTWLSSLSYCEPLCVYVFPFSDSNGPSYVLYYSYNFFFCCKTPLCEILIIDPTSNVLMRLICYFIVCISFS